MTTLDKHTLPSRKHILEVFYSNICVDDVPVKIVRDLNQTVFRVFSAVDIW